MLTLTPNATDIVRNIANQSPEPDNAGLRITSDGSAEAPFAVTAADAAQPGDQVVSQEGAHVYLDEPTAGLLDDKVLDARVDEEGRIEFALGQQA
ncbi:Fe-S cluster assembly iron-binding protein IscA [Nocardioides terrae]|uniref:Fe-S cluster assembly iron-binding protein IscA n=1 Tax=Nocardioides terrae TaxID=574651 RepID=A0A1I1NCG3_9ACTN|nr:Fe-S cluster assembly protein HesB [Nocardioides terrae]SFC95227.1 Fe-S cluster assembly iron-binding protein IscA [Nocardioides terrae]